MCTCRSFLKYRRHSILHPLSFVYLLVLGLGQLLFGPLSDRIGRRPILLAGALLFSLASFFLAMTGNAACFVILRMIQALGASAALVATFATVCDV